MIRPRALGWHLRCSGIRWPASHPMGRTANCCTINSEAQPEEKVRFKPRRRRNVGLRITQPGFKARQLCLSARYPPIGSHKPTSPIPKAQFPSQQLLLSRQSPCRPPSEPDETHGRQNPHVWSFGSCAWQTFGEVHPLDSTTLPASRTLEHNPTQVPGCPLSPRRL
jgi:hypothetical protein